MPEGELVRLWATSRRVISLDLPSEMSSDELVLMGMRRHGDGRVEVDAEVRCRRSEAAFLPARIRAAFGPEEAAAILDSLRRLEVRPFGPLDFILEFHPPE